MADITLPGASRASRLHPFPVWVLVYAVVTMGVLLLLNLPVATDYVGGDNDDVMRLVQIRDLLAGQSWFDLTQYRLGLDGGTLMHWSRLIDLPIAVLIRLFAYVLTMEKAEALALLVWPLMLILPLMAAVAVAARRMGDDVTMHVALLLTSVFVVTANRFLPGAIDHHNVQLVLGGDDCSGSPRSVAGCAWSSSCRARGCHGHRDRRRDDAVRRGILRHCCSLWAIEAGAYAKAARAFSLTLLVSLSAFFFAMVPPAQYDVVTCDSLSLGFYAVVGIGAASLFIVTQLPGMRDIRLRIASLAVIAALVGLGAVTSRRNACRTR